ncbi:MAG: sodium:alanine symporter family protein [Ruminococcaceae bacterium]|nr:sodium:alanine symporter family protein [Oscillospiraceae bacterium]
MENFISWLTEANSWLNSIVWGVPAMVLILGTGLLLTIATRFTQFTRFGYAMRNTVGRIRQSRSDVDRGAVTPFQAVCTALAATVGTGNIAGVAGAIALGGPGAVFWMWVAALVGMITKYAEVVLAIHYRQRNEKGEWVGGPMYYIRNGLGRRWTWLAGVFAVLAILASFGIGNIAQINSIAGAVTGAVQMFDPAANVKTVCLITGLLVMAAVALISIGGLKRIARVTEMLVPAMSALYIVSCLVVILGNIGSIGRVFVMIFTGAFQPSAVVGGGLGITIMTAMKRGVSRGIFSNEAGLGSAPIAHAAAHTDSPVRQGLFGIFEVFADTLVICTLTALTILSSGVDVAYGQKAGAELSTRAFSTVFSGQVSSVVIAVALSLFALTTILSWNLYGSRCCEYLFGSARAALIYKLLFLPVVVMGATMDLQLAWDISDTLNGLMAIPNLIGVLLLSPVVVKLTREYFARQRGPKLN